MLVRQTLTPAAVGGAVGLGAAALGGGALEHLLFGVTPRDGVTFASVALLVGLVTWLACRAPAERAARVVPAVALRAE